MTADELQTVLVVDDVPENIDVLVEVLSPDYRFKAARSAKKALERCDEDPPDLVLLDVMMPEMNGFEACHRLKASARTRRIPVIFVTSRDEVTDETTGFAAGAVDYINKPVSPPVVRARVRTHLAIHDQNRVLEERVRARTHQLTQMQDLATLAEYRDNETGGHILRTRDYVRLLAGRLLDHPRFRDELDREVIELMVKSTPLHDVGKVAVPDAILLKPGKLTAGEFERMKLHTVHGRDAIRSTEEVLDGSAADSFLRYARQVAYSHHERWDGAGYPEGLAGEEIPLCARSWPWPTSTTP